MFFDLHRVVYAVFPDRKTAEQVAAEVVDLKLAACANIFPEHTAIYLWEGKSEKSAEVAVIFKSTAAAVDLLIAEIKAKHPYKIPAIVSWPITNCDPDYAKWISETVKL